MPHTAAAMKLNLFDNVVKPRLFGRTAERIKRLAAQTGMSENKISNRVADAGISAVEKQFRSVVTNNPPVRKQNK